MSDSRLFKNSFFTDVNDFKYLISSATEVAIIATDEKGLIRLFNKGAQKMLGYAASEVVEKKTVDFIHYKEELRQREIELSKELGKEVKGLSVFSAKPLLYGAEQREWIYKRKDGRKVFVSVSVTPVYDEYDKLKGFLAISSDISKRKKAESSLKKSEKAVRDMADNIPGVVFQLYSRGENERGFYYLSPKTEELFGIFPDKRKFTELFIRQLHKDCKSDFIKSINDAFKQKKNWFFEGKFIKKSGDILWFQGRAQPAVYEDEIIYNGVLLDITDSKVAEEKLKESEERFSILVNASFGGIGIHDEGTILDCNQGLSEITGYSIDELIGMDGLKLIAPESVELVKNNIINDYPGVYDAWGIRKNGNIYPVEIRGKNIPYQDRNLRVTEFRDISLRKEKEQELKDNEENIRAIVNSIGEGVIATDINGFVTRMNPTAENITGCKFEGCAGENISEVIRFSSDEKQITGKEVVKKIISAGTNMIISNSVGIVSSDEKTTLASCTGAPVRNSKQEITGIVIVIRDISEETKLQKQLQQSRKLESIGQLAGGGCP
jgi:PAS domain S-box-containing protein